MGAVVRDRRVWAIGLVSLFLNPFDEPFVGFTIALLERERGASAGVATVVAFIGVSGGLVAFTVLARRFRHVPDSRLLSGAAA